MRPIQPSSAIGGIRIIRVLWLKPHRTIKILHFHDRVFVQIRRRRTPTRTPDRIAIVPFSPLSPEPNLPVSISATNRRVWFRMVALVPNINDGALGRNSAIPRHHSSYCFSFISALCGVVRVSFCATNSLAGVHTSRQVARLIKDFRFLILNVIPDPEYASAGRPLVVERRPLLPEVSIRTRPGSQIGFSRMQCCVASACITKPRDAVFRLCGICTEQ